MIAPSHQPLSYASERTVFTPNDRYSQLRETLSSINEYSLNCKTILCELSLGRSVGNMMDEISRDFPNVNIIQPRETSSLYRYVYNSPFKAIGEIYAWFLISCHFFFGKSQRSFKSTHICKLSGRYHFTSCPSWLTNYSKPFSFRVYPQAYSTRAFRFSYRYLPCFLLLNLIAVPFLFSGVSLERLYRLLIPRSIVFPAQKLMIKGLIGVNGQEIFE
jgi:hypothetical protein